jgi:Tfp pilus assembly protein PilV
MRYQQGFTLVETILFIIVVAIGLTGITLVFTQGAKYSHEPFIQQRSLNLAQTFMDEIMKQRWDENTPVGGGCTQTGSNACIASSNTWNASTLYVADEIVVPTTANGCYYTTDTTGTSGATEPTWPTTLGQTVSDGSITWYCLAMDATPVAGYGPEGTESRSQYDDVDDYHGLNQSPPQDNSGTAINGYNGYTIDVQVSQPAANWNGIDLNDVKQIDITVTPQSPDPVSFRLRAYRINY